MTNREESRKGPAVLAACILAFLLFRFGRYYQSTGFDLIQHYLLIDEIMKHGGVRPESSGRIGAMALYPPVAHWLASIVGWIGGSGLVGITLVSITSVFACYLMIMRLIGRIEGILLFTGLFFLLTRSYSLIGWEVVVNFFYPQLVADVLYFSVLLWVSREQSPIVRAVVFLVAGTLAMWIQPLVAVHILATGCVLLASQALVAWVRTSKFPMGTAAVVAFLACAAAAVVTLHPAFKVMRTISTNDGYLVLGYPHVMAVALLCGCIGALNMWRQVRRRGLYVDAVLGSAALAAAVLAIVQFAMLKLHGDGSAYAVKKHMFIVLTMGVINGVRILTTILQSEKPGAAFAGPIAAGLCSFSILTAFNTPAAPVNSAMDRATHAADYRLADFRPDDIVFYDDSIPRLANVMISLAAFQHPFDAVAIGWAQGKDMLEGSALAMVRRTPAALEKCPLRKAESREYMIIDPACMK